MNLFEKTKSYPITKQRVWEAFKLVKSKGGAAGVDGVTIEMVAADPKKYLYPVWNRLASGSYFPPAVKQVEIPKGDGGVRKLGVPTVTDRVAQMVIAKELEAIVDKQFSPSSYGYRPNRNAHQAVEQAKRNCWQFSHVVDMDIKGFFDNIDHGLMIRALRHFTEEKHIVAYAKRWLKAPIQLKDGSQIQNRDKGTPQGGVISPLLANIFLHFAFDKWMETNFPEYPFERYADDIIIHVGSEAKAELVLDKVKERMQKCKLELHPEKTKIVYCPSLKRKGNQEKPKQFDFLGFTFRPRKVVTKKGKITMGFLPAISKKSAKRIVGKWADLNIHKWTTNSIEELSKLLSPMLRGWIQYYGKISKHELNNLFVRINNRLAKWAYRKYKRFKRHKSFYLARKWLRNVAHRYSYLFPHWELGFKP
jgi:RNA-directed DNA polymerase